jgi:hypothetical protein
LLFLPVLVAGCAGPYAELVATPAEEAAWRQVAATLPGTPIGAIERCAGPPRSAAPAAPDVSALVYFTQDLKNYCRVTLFVQNGRVASFTADHAAPEFFGLRDGSNYCGRMFQACLP